MNLFTGSLLVVFTSWLGLDYLVRRHHRQRRANWIARVRWEAVRQDAKAA